MQTTQVICVLASGTLALAGTVPAHAAGPDPERAAGRIRTAHADKRGYAMWPKPYERNPMSRATGKLLSRDARGEPEPCTASVVRSRSRDLLVTAAHCVREIGPRGRFHKKITFIPGYSAKADPDDGHNYGVRAPYGVWRVRKAWVAPRWKRSHADFYDPSRPIRFSAYDMAVVSVAPRHGRRIQDVVGGFAPLPTGRQAFRFTTLGYPGGGIAPYLGNVLHRCDGRARTAPPRIGPGAAWTRNCYVIPGHSGGPWIVRSGGGLKVAAVTSAQVARGSLGAGLKSTTFGGIFARADQWSLRHR